MENFPQNTQETVSSTELSEAEYSGMFNRMLTWMKGIEKVLEDPNSTEQAREEAIKDRNEFLDTIRDNSNGERNKMGARGAVVTKDTDLTNEERMKGAASDDKYYVNQDGFVGSDPDIKKAAGSDNWVSNTGE